MIMKLPKMTDRSSVVGRLVLGVLGHRTDLCKCLLFGVCVRGARRVFFAALSFGWLDGSICVAYCLLLMLWLLFSFVYFGLLLFVCLFVLCVCVVVLLLLLFWGEGVVVNTLHLLRIFPVLLL